MPMLHPFFNIHDVRANIYHPRVLSTPSDNIHFEYVLFANKRYIALGGPDNIPGNTSLSLNIYSILELELVLVRDTPLATGTYIHHLFLSFV